MDPRPINDRLRWLDRFRALVAVRHPELVARTVDEVGKPPFEALTADILPLLASCRWHRREARRLLAPRRVGGGGFLGFGHRAVRQRLPVGRVLVIATWNYPVQLLGIQMVQALVAGNDLVVKPSERAPATQEFLVGLAAEAAETIPSMRGAVSIRPATRAEGARVLAEERFDHVVFTGSTEVGRAIAETCAARLVPSTLELSGSDSAIVLDDADAVRAARAVFMGFTANAGQTCMAPRRALVSRGAAAAFTDELARLVAGARRATLVDAEAAARAAEVAREAVRAGGRSIAGALEPASGRTLRPAAIVGCPVETALFAGRHFGPVLAVRTVADEREAFALHAMAPRHLATSIWTRRTNAALEARARAAGSSLVHFNAVLLPSAHPGLSLGGHGQSGWGVSRGASGLLGLTREVTVTRSNPRFAPPLGEPSDRVRAALSRLLAFPRRPEPAAPRPATHAPVETSTIHEPLSTTDSAGASRAADRTGRAAPRHEPEGTHA
ncbi:MAG: putative succinate-semialdehyde dehydrogenase 2 [Planctomycetota bacterium]